MVTEIVIDYNDTAFLLLVNPAELTRQLVVAPSIPDSARASHLLQRSTSKGFRIRG